MYIYIYIYRCSACPPAGSWPKPMTKARPSPRRAAKHVDAHELAELLAGVLPAVCIDRFKKDSIIFEHNTLDMKREISHEHLSNQTGILGALLDSNETGIYTQDDMKATLAALAAKLGLKGVDIELESYKLRVMLSHLRITKARGVPQNLVPRVLGNINFLIGKLGAEAIRHERWE